eukprot:TRINITY_DN6671_c0_g1_i2.p1 TRINITY_DN6671_c0_g1~~TRINITY_DN6671_c0_g1_i2.p1  ORF type:complete len:554 (+),score=183.99 TRINITY_DN6671_c0_g1_i2:236-1897(+)
MSGRLEVVLVRHGMTEGLEARARGQDAAHLERDDPLSARGLEEARMLGSDVDFVQDVLGAADLVLCSPLSRALATCSAVLEASGARPRVLVSPELREFNRLRCDGHSRLYWRHVGRPRAELERLECVRALAECFDFSLLPAGECGWWDAGADGVCRVEYDAAYWRAQRFLAELRRMAVAVGLKRVVLFGHENCFRKLTGAAAFPHPPHYAVHCLPLALPAPTSSRRFLWGSPELAKCPRAAYNGERAAIVVLGCSDTAEHRRRLLHAAALFRERARPLLCVCSTGDTGHADPLQVLQEALSAEEVERYVTVDESSVTTECNMDMAAAILAALDQSMDPSMRSPCEGEEAAAERGQAEPWAVALVTNGWHMPRALLLHEMSAASRALRLHVSPCACRYEAGESPTAKYLPYGFHLAGMLLDDACVDALLRRWRDMVPEVRELRTNMRLFSAQRTERVAPQAALAQLKSALGAGDSAVLALLQKHIEIAHMPMGSHGSYALHYCASHGRMRLCIVLVFAHACSPAQRNAKGRTPQSYTEDTELIALLDELATVLD